jgi:class 3 adenylate cyclase
MTRKENRPNETGVGEISRPTKGQIVQRTESDLSQTIIFANMRHELRTLLNAIIGYSEMLLEDAENLHQEAFITDLQKIHTAGKEMLGLVNEILDPSNVEKDQFDLDWDSLEAKLSYTLRTPLNAVIGYSELLIENAEELRQETFIPDLQKIHSASETFLGFIKEIVNFSKIKAGIMNAEVGSSETSDMVKGVVSTIRPLSEEDAIFVTADRSAILVVDDNEMNRDLLSRHLERQGHIITIAENGCQALEIIKNHTFDLILLDVIMPEMNGYQVLQRLKSDDTWRDIPVLMISALEEGDIVMRCIEIGADDYLTKPFNPVLLRARINACRERKRLRDLEKEQKRILKETFGKYVDEEVRDEVLSGRIPLDGEKKDVTVMFADLRDFTPLTESTPPKDVVKILNGYFTEMTPAIRRRRGSILQYVGDEIYSVFGAPLPLKAHPYHALEAALDMRRLLVVVNEKLKRQGYAPLRHGIGIHSGPIVAANIGSPDRLAYNLVGDTVNLASRIQGITKKFDEDILISAATRARLHDDFAVEKMPTIKLKGKRAPVEIFRVI